MSAGSTAVVAKARCKYGKMLTLSDYRQLAAKNDVSYVVAALKTLPGYKKYFSDVTDSSVRRNQAEQLLYKWMLGNYTDLCNFKFRQKNGFFRYLLKREEIAQIIKAIMYISAGEHENFILYFPMFLQKYSEVKFMELVKARTFKEVLAHLEGTAYYKVLKPLLPEGALFPEIRAVETVMGYHFHEWLTTTIKKEFSGKEREEVEKCVLHSADIYNMRLCYRLKGIFKMTNEEVMNNHLPYHSRFSEKDMRKLLEKSDSEPIEALIRKHPYFKGSADKENADFETMVSQSKLDFFRKKLMLSQYDSVVLFSFAELMAIEISNLTTIIEGIRYSIPSAEIEKMLII